MSARDEVPHAGVHVTAAGSHLQAEVTDLVVAWAQERRWFPGGLAGRPEPWLEVTVEAAPDVVVALLWAQGTVVQVPLVVVPLGRGEPTGPGYIGTAAGLALHDAGAHPAGWAALLRAAGITSPDLTAGHTVTGEQSNTSVVLPKVRPDGAPHGAMLKILRTVVNGQHPDVAVPQALTAAGFTGTPRFLGAVEITMPETPETPGAPPSAPAVLPSAGAPALAHLAVLAALVPDAQDGFELACAFAGRSEQFDVLAAELGTVVAHLHATLRVALPTTATLDPEPFVARLRRRAAAALDAAPTALAPHAAAVARVLDDLQARLTAVPLQRIHGDLHLGQALHNRDGWQLLDFEGEPQRPVAERTAPDLPLRDVAGMVRSFDYAAAVGGAHDASWASDAQRAFLDGYLTAAGAAALDTATASAVLRALVLDKALYEVVYEVRQRPHWVHIPLGAVERLVQP